MVTRDALARIRGSRIGSTTGRTTSPARPNKNTAPKPTVVAAKRSRRRAGLSGASRAPHRQARKRYAKEIASTAGVSRYQFAWLTAVRTSPQFSLRPNHQRIATARRQRAPNSRYLRDDDFKVTIASLTELMCGLTSLESKPQDIGASWKPTTVWLRGARNGAATILRGGMSQFGTKKLGTTQDSFIELCRNFRFPSVVIRS